MGGSSVTPGVELLTNDDEMCTTSKQTIPDPELDVYGAPMAYADSTLVISGGWDLSTNSPTAMGVRLNLDSNTYSWESTGFLPTYPTATVKIDEENFGLGWVEFLV